MSEETLVKKKKKRQAILAPTKKGSKIVLASPQSITDIAVAYETTPHPEFAGSRYAKFPGACKITKVLAVTSDGGNYGFSGDGALQSFLEKINSDHGLLEASITPRQHLTWLSFRPALLHAHLRVANILNPLPGAYYPAGVEHHLVDFWHYAIGPETEHFAPDVLRALVKNIYGVELGDDYIAGADIVRDFKLMVDTIAKQRTWE